MKRRSLEGDCHANVVRSFPGPGWNDPYPINALVTPERTLPHRVSDDVPPDAVGQAAKLGELAFEKLASNLDFPNE